MHIKIQGTKDLALSLKKARKPITGLVDADWGACTIDRKSCSGLCFIYAGSVIGWESRK
jgi:hypothetical protein